MLSSSVCRRVRWYVRAFSKAEACREKLIAAHIRLIMSEWAGFSEFVVILLRSLAVPSSDGISALSSSVSSGDALTIKR
jgi:hypothetical protein